MRRIGEKNLRVFPAVLLLGVLLAGCAEKETAAEPVTEESSPAAETTAAAVKTTEDGTVLKERPEDGDLLKGQTFTALIPANRYGGNCEEGDYAEGRFLLWVQNVRVSDTGEILEKETSAVPYIVSDHGQEEHLSVLSGGMDGENPYGETVWVLTADEKGEITDAFPFGKEETGEKDPEEGYFVAYGKKVYYRLPKEEAMQKSALFGAYLSGYCGPSEIRCYDTETGVSETLCDSTGYGKLRLSGDSLIAKEKVYENGEEKECLVRISLTDGTKEVMDQPGISDAASMVYAVSGDLVIYEEDDYGKNEYALYCLNTGNGSALRLGSLEKLGETGYPGELQQLVKEGDDLWFTMSAYQGTGHFFSEAKVYHAKLNEADSLSSFGFEELETVNGNKASEEFGEEFTTDHNRAPAFVIKEGKLLVTEGEPGTSFVSYPDGILSYYDGDGRPESVAGGYGTFVSEEEGTRVSIELSEMKGKQIFLVRNEEWRDEAGDVGWREAYSRKDAYVVKVDPETGEETIIDYRETVFP